jgi:hypothetical protein
MMDPIELFSPCTPHDQAVSMAQASKYLNSGLESAGLFRDKFEVEPFAFQHALTFSPLLQLPRLRELCIYCSERPRDFHFEIGEAAAGDKWRLTAEETTLVNAFDGLDVSKTLILLKGVHSHPEYRALMKDYLTELSELLGFDFARRYHRPICTIIIASPARVTPYHMDAEMNLLMQVQGTKQFYVFNGNDTDILSPEALERFWGASEMNAADHSADRQKKAILFELAPGRGVHVPLTFPHWALSGPEISVAVSVNFKLIKCEQANLYRANYLLRRFGFNPSKPGLNKAADARKSGIFQTALTIRDASRSLLGRRTPEVI